MSKYILFRDTEILGYLDTEEEAKNHVYNIVNQIIRQIKKTEENTRVFNESIKNGIRIYTQTTGTILDGRVTLKNSITYSELKKLEEEVV